MILMREDRDPGQNRPLWTSLGISHRSIQWIVEKVNILLNELVTYLLEWKKKQIYW